jgi:hypothetical protein
VPNVTKNSRGASNPFIQHLRKLDREEQLVRTSGGTGDVAKVPPDCIKSFNVQ